ncbi:MAG TPA: porin [Burkholderiaceae bacterium]|nr:porin [Burkholderiaceae bacterium]
MKKNLIALAIFGAFSGAALAQSNVTLYGIIDVNYQYNDPDASGASSTSGINSGHQSGSRFGIRGSEALSPNLNAVFTIEGGMDVSTGTSLQGGRLFGRQAWGGLSGGWGTLVLGRVATFSSGTGSFDMFGSVDPFLTGFGDSSLGSTFTPSGALRLDNSALYQSPSFGGFKFGAGYSFNGNGSEVAGSGNNNKVWFFGANFAAGPFFAAVTYDTIDLANGPVSGSAATPAIPANANDQKMLQIGGTFDLKFLKLHAAYAKEDNVWFNVGLGGVPDPGANADAWMAGVTIPLFGGSLLGSYQDRSGDGVNVCTGVPGTAGACSAAIVNREVEKKVWAIGYAYPLSRRTNLYINFSDTDTEVRTTAVAPALPVSTTGEAGRKQYTIGMRHLF